MEKKPFTSASKLLNDDEAFKEILEKDIFKRIISIKTAEGKMGTGFLYTSTFGFSNAHVLPRDWDSENEGSEKVIVRNYESNPVDIQEWHIRPSDKEDSPDIAIFGLKKSLNVTLESFGHHFNEDPRSEDCVFFYVYFEDMKHTKVTYMRLKKFDTKFECPLIYETTNDEDPQPGSSGAPILKATVVDLSNRKLHFEIVGVLFGRRPSEIEKENLADKKMLVCGVPIVEDFKQLYPIKTHLDECENLKQKIFYLETDKKEFSTEIKETKEKLKEFEQGALGLVKQYKEGVTSLNITCLFDVEKLYGIALFKFTKSILLKKIQNKYWDPNRAFKFESLQAKFDDASELRQNFQELLQEIRETDKILLTKYTKDHLYDKDYLRADVAMASNRQYMITVQDNTHSGSNKGHHMKTEYKNNDPMSSDFARVLLPVNCDTFAGTLVADALQWSYYNSETFDFKKKEIVENSDKKKKQKGKNDFEKNNPWCQAHNKANISDQKKDIDKDEEKDQDKDEDGDEEFKPNFVVIDLS